MADPERERLDEVPQGRTPWRHWGPHLSERALGASHHTGWTGLVANLLAERVFRGSGQRPGV